MSDDLRLSPGVHKVQVNTLRPGDVIWWKRHAAVVERLTHQDGALHVWLAGQQVRRYRTTTHVNATRSPEAP